MARLAFFPFYTGISAKSGTHSRDIVERQFCPFPSGRNLHRLRLGITVLCYNRRGIGRPTAQKVKRARVNCEPGRTITMLNVLDTRRLEAIPLLPLKMPESVGQN